MNLQKLLLADLERQDFYANIPDAPKTMRRVILKALSPRFMPVVLYRLSHFFWQKNFSPLAKFFSLLNFWCFGLEIAVRSEIGGGLYLPHTVGTVLSAERIGQRCVIFGQVVLGAKEVDFAFTSAARPILGDDVMIGTGAKILGGINIGDRVKVGANAVVIRDVPNDSMAVGVPAIHKPLEAHS